MDRNPGVDWGAVDDTILGCANQAGEDNRNVARMAVLLAGLPEGVSGSTINRLCGSGLDAIGSAARAIRSGDAEFMIAGGVESMTRAPYVMGKAHSPFDRAQKLEDTTLRGGSRNLNSGDKWIADLTAAMLAAKRKQDEQATPPEPQSGIQGQGGAGCCEG